MCNVTDIAALAAIAHRHGVDIEGSSRVLPGLVGFISVDNVPAEVATGSRIGQVRGFAQKGSQQVNWLDRHAGDETEG